MVLSWAPMTCATTIMLSTHEAVTAASGTTSGRRARTRLPSSSVTTKPASGSSGMRAIMACTAGP